ncbi:MULTISPECIES: hypothetical protein [Sphingobium]|jgi:hypothetical protein|uniref:hypothetical protein n=1 Tax=Sphingobium TaxID=165695 RepID=UPI000C477959|nr:MULTISPECIES: hypothetical protein [Sphingobium]MAP45714.1 hypothetical protein [Sphingobium sp.]MEC9018446.1 hypothetical protein [Pseudomonadota bacterium]MAX15718.1 hypothetical protein [Sphingobium sp.]MBS47665.1 hypothetical protein [Sphingobium sp.]MCC4255927.1 hypothetical protein [Sphingobium lactosutens]|tara:strand:- start:3814 stop:4134 length:321 start_codon:yes stop_codon:yes gene_type:complete
MAVRQKWWIGAMLIVVICLGLLAWNGPAIHARAQLGAAYGARIGCSCRYVEGRPMGNCTDDKEPGMGLVKLTDAPEQRAVRASVPLLATRTARYRPGWGCLLDPAK